MDPAYIQLMLNLARSWEVVSQTIVSKTFTRSADCGLLAGSILIFFCQTKYNMGYIVQSRTVVVESSHASKIKLIDSL